ncbi:uncharacterized protein [Miscanthus floridulus]|uniref:uncharacterized protein n=1 Tax=Miscanthus floridulus TaxID=154761 RepID=UPI00345A8B4C
MHFDCLQLKILSDQEVSWGRELAKEDQMKRIIKSLAQEFFPASSSAAAANCSVLERWTRWWFTELGIGWVLHVADGTSQGILQHAFDDARCWSRALAEIMETVRSTDSVIGLPCICEEEQQPMAAENSSSFPDQFQFARFVQETLFKMLTFVDVIVALDPNTITCDIFIANGVLALFQKISDLVRVRAALSYALSQIDALFLWTPSVEVRRIRGEILNFLRSKDVKALEGIWSTLEEIWTRILELIDDSSSASAQTSQGSSDIHKLTWSVMDHITFLLDNYSIVAPIVLEAARLGKYVPRNGDLPPFDSMIMEMMSCLEKMLVNMSESFPDLSRRLLFLLNNSYFILERLQDAPHLHMQFPVRDLTSKVDGYMDKYLQVSWAPVLSCLFNTTPLFLFGKYYPSLALHTFESEFQKTYTTQKLCKVPDPKLRKMLRKDITEKIIPSYTKYIEDNKVKTVQFGPQYLEEMLQELFEG